MKHDIASKNAVEIDSLQAYFWFSCKVCKHFYFWFVKAICFATPKLHFATHSLRSPGLNNDCSHIKFTPWQCCPYLRYYNSK